MVFIEYSDICNYNNLQILITKVTVIVYYAVQNIYYLENNIYIVVISMSIVQPVLTPSSFTCGNKKTGLSKTIGVKKQPRKSKHAC